jgi:hypothetical protein
MTFLSPEIVLGSKWKSKLLNYRKDCDFGIFANSTACFRALRDESEPSIGTSIFLYNAFHIVLRVGCFNWLANWS